MAETVEHHKVKRVYGRRMGRPMHKARLDVLDTILPRRKVGEELLTEKADKTPDDIFGETVDRLHFEIGFGNGEHLHYIMEQFPDDYFIGAEPYINGMTAFLKDFGSEDVPKNFRVHMDDALMVLNSLKDASVDFLYILNPDPWPKSRHHKRRIVSPQNLEVFARVLKDGGVMLQTTDVDDLAEWMVTQTVNCPHFEWTAERPEDWKTAPNGWMATRYENKGKDAGRSQTYLVYKRRPRS
ncbi:MAG TPA: tRNA (guanosine(46)-N7)-methyltransferase TrmB [Alphaproteobacteria bacterium]|nr:tRNA (guanosine(46)-N7)-methyltransferase TrmB [Alphaproteobacteria bacterium]HNS45530.1 tRNA (guanosine(46)-N7)-methyltransferase TrmB [Alphaproteobacteria bacterium]